MRHFPSRWVACLFLSICANASHLDAQTLPENPVVLNPLWRISFGPDYATSASATEMQQHAPSGLLYYVPSTPTDPTGPQLQTLYRLVSPDGSDHMDSISAGEGGYTTEGPLGYSWVSPTAHSGLSPILRIYDNQAGTPNSGDHALMVGPNALPGASAENSFVSSGYFPEGWVDYSATSTLDTSYGAGFWTNRSTDPSALGRISAGMPCDTFFASGNLGQRVYIVPSSKLVIVRKGVTQKRPDFDIAGDIRLIREMLVALGLTSAPACAATT